MPGAGTCDPAWHDPSPFWNETLKEGHILEIDIVHFFAAKPANSFAAIEVTTASHSFLLLLLWVLLLSA
jgi:hypothetical protein